MTLEKRERRLRRRSKQIIMKKRLGLLALLFFVLFLIFSFVKSNFSFKVTKYKISSYEIPNAFNGFKIAQISDLHAGVFGENQEKIVKKLEEEKVNIVVFTGDLISRNSSNLEKFAKSLEEIIKTYPSYYIPGNHELMREGNKEYKDFLALLEKEGMIMLGNKTYPLYRRGAFIQISGLDEGLSFYEVKADKNHIPVESLITAPDERVFSMLLAHNPLYFNSYVNWGADLVLAGHVHGGVIRLPLIGGILSPEVGLFPKYDKGLYTSGHQNMIVSVGMGDSFPGFRLFNQKELVIVELESQSIH